MLYSNSVCPEQIVHVSSVMKSFFVRRNTLYNYIFSSDLLRFVSEL